MIEYYISSTKYSLQERNTKRGKVYDVVFRVVTLTGEEKQKKLCGFFTKTAAKEAYTEFVTEKCELVKNNPLKKKKQNTDYTVHHTVRELFPAYLATLNNQTKESTIYDKQNIYRLFIAPTLGDTKVKDLTKEILYQWQDQMWSTKNPRTNDFYAYKYLRKIKSHFSAFLDWCESRHGYKNYLLEVTTPRRRAPKKEMEIWTREEFTKFIETVDEPIYKALFMLLFYTGMRKGEAFALSPSDATDTAIKVNKSLMRKTVDGSAYKITSTKTYKNREVPICKPLQYALVEYKTWLEEDKDTNKAKQFLFGGEKPLAENTVTRAFKRYINAAGVKMIRMHDLRHSFVSLCIHLGANLTVIADLIGDTVEQVTKTYGHMYETDKLSVISKIQ